MWLGWSEGWSAILVLGQGAAPVQAADVFSLLRLMIGKFFETLRDVVPIVAVILFFQLAILRRPIVNLKKVLWGAWFVLFGLAFLLVGLEVALFPIGKAMAEQLTKPEFLNLPPQVFEPASNVRPAWYHFYWTYIFAFLISFSTTIAEPALIAVAIKAQEVSGGAVQAWGLRIAVAIGAGIGVALGTLRIILGVPLPYFIFVGYLIVMMQTYFAPKQIVPLAYDSGGVTTSTVTVPIVAALGWGLSANLPGRSPLVDGFGMIALAVLFPMMTVMAYAQLSEIYRAFNQRQATRTSNSG
jgi:hypothetical protein